MRCKSLHRCSTLGDTGERPCSKRKRTVALRLLAARRWPLVLLREPCSCASCENSGDLIRAAAYLMGHKEVGKHRLEACKPLDSPTPKMQGLCFRLSTCDAPPQPSQHSQESQATQRTTVLVLFGWIQDDRGIPGKFALQSDSEQISEATLREAVRKSCPSSPKPLSGVSENRRLRPFRPSTFLN